MKTLRLLFLSLLALAAPTCLCAQLRVATLHPILTDLATQVGGTHTQVIGLIPPGADIHHFSPTPSDVKKIATTPLILAAGKNLENYLPKLQSNLQPGQTLLEVGRTIPSLKIDPANAMFMCCPEHARGAIDPHWWNSIDNMQRAARIIADAMSSKDPTHKADYKANAAAYSQRLSGLKKWAKQQLSVIPSTRRKLATAHLSLAYFAREYDFKLVPVQGLNHNTTPTPQELTHSIATIKTQGVSAVFPEQNVNPKYLRELARETGVKTGGDLIGDGNGTGKLHTFEAAFTSNVNTITAALKP